MSDTVISILHEAYDESAANLVLVHGAMDRGMAFRGVVARLHDYNTTVYDRRGYGASLDMPLASDISDHVDDLAGVIGDKPAIVVGHSYGGLVAMLAASRHPELIPAIGVYEPPLPGITLATDTDIDEAAPPSDPEALVRWFYRRTVGESVFDQMGEHAQKALIAEAPALAADMGGAAPATHPFDPKSVTVPTLVGYGGQSIARHIARAQWLAEHLPGGSLMEAPDAAHPCHRTHPEQFVAFIKATVALAG